MNKFVKNQSGRSMVEMLGVLAIIGVLSVGGIAGYSLAMQKYRTSQGIEDVQLLMTNVRTLFAAQDNYADLTNDLLANAGILTSKDQKSSFGTNLTITAGAAGQVGTGGTAYLKDETFTITVVDVPAASCVPIATSNWGTVGSGFLGLDIGGTIVNPPITVKSATDKCAGAVKTLKWYFK